MRKRVQLCRARLRTMRMCDEAGMPIATDYYATMRCWGKCCLTVEQVFADAC